ncbi:hypothetical protein LJB42_001234 [Komagataella kurtzmanii]|nr:hypothetical protein LJB42_001234 [Komagataella kurtzmanii]
MSEPQSRQASDKTPPGTPERRRHTFSMSHSPSRRRSTPQTVYGDRYIPTRTGIDLQAAFSLQGTVTHDAEEIRRETAAETTDTNDLNYIRQLEADRTFNRILKTELFGDQLSIQNSDPNSAQLNTTIVSPQTPPRHTRTDSDNEDTLGDIDRITSTSGNGKGKDGRNLFSYKSPGRRGPGIGMGTKSGVAHSSELYSVSPVRQESQRLLLSPQKKTRAISKVAYRVLDAPELADDYYLNLVDWGAQDILAVGLGSSVYLWDAASGSVSRLCELSPREAVTSVSWIQAGTHLAVGTQSGLVEIWDATTSKCTRSMTGHSARTSALSWNRHVLSSGSRDRSILHRDVRAAAHYTSRIVEHRQEVCGLRWNVDENKLASGSNDNRMMVWDALRVDQPLMKVEEHTAAVKALAWSPHQRGILASGGGTADRRIKVWNTLTGSKLHDVDTGSQVCNLLWSRNSNELVSTHGYSRNQVVIWKYPQMKQLASLTGHTYRVLYLSMSPDGTTVVTGAGDETLRFWNCFEKSRQSGGGSILLDAFSQLR